MGNWQKMSNDNNLTCPCKECGKDIQFPEKSAGTVEPCPHCGQWTELTAESVSSDPAQAKRKSIGLMVLLGCVLVLIAAAGFFVWHHHNQNSAQPIEPSPPKVATAPTNLPATNSAPVIPAVAEKRPKSPDDLKTGPVQFEKTKGSGLVYAVGTVTNGSEYQRFGVRIELDLFDKNGRKLGTAKDYKDVIEPNREWQFHALALNPKATSAKVASLTEE